MRTCTCTRIDIDIKAVLGVVLESLDGGVDGSAEVPAVDCGVSTEGGVEEVRTEGVERYLRNSEHGCEWLEVIGSSWK